MNERVELPIVTETEPAEHISLMLIADGLRQTDQNLSEQEANMKKLSEQLQNLQNLRIATTAQRNLLLELQKRIKEVESNSQKSA